MRELPRYCAPGGELSQAMIADYEKTGVLIIEDFADASSISKLLQRIRSLVDGFDPDAIKHVFSALQQSQMGDDYFESSGDKIRYFFEHDAFDDNGELLHDKHQSLNKMGHAMHDLDPVFDAFSRTPSLANVARCLGIDDPVIIQSMVIFKPPRIGGEVHFHQDSTFIYTEPQSCVGFWFALEDATVDNGCMQFIPGGHLLGLKQRQFRDADGKLKFATLDDAPWPEGAELPAEARAGSLVIFDGCTPHASGPNTSSASRQAYTLHAVDRSCHYPLENWLQRSEELPLRGFAA